MIIISMRRQNLLIRTINKIRRKLTLKCNKKHGKKIGAMKLGTLYFSISLLELTMILQIHKRKF